MSRNAAWAQCLRLAALLVGAAGVTRAGAQGTVSLEVDSTDVYVNESFVVGIRVDRFQTCEAPVFPDLPGVSARDIGAKESTQTTIVNGRRTDSHSRLYRYELTASAAGELVIPSITVLVDGRQRQTKPARIQVRPAERLCWIEITSDRPRAYVGQQLRLTLSLWVKGVRTQSGLLDPRDLLSMGCLRVVDFGPFSPREVSTDTRRSPDSGGGADLYYVYETSTTYVPDRPGRPNLGTIDVAIQYPTRFTRDLFGRWELADARNLHARATSPDLEIVPLPVAGRPPNFTGAVGRFGLFATATPTSVRVGDPIQLTLDLQGDGPLDSLPAPNLSADPRLGHAFRVPTETLAGEVSTGRKRFTAIIRATRADVTEIPPIEYPYFDPDRELYVVALSDPIPLTVAPAAELPTASLVDASAATAQDRSAPLRISDGLRDNETRETELLRNERPVQLNRLALVTLAPPGVYLALWGLTRYAQNRTPAQRRRQHALRTARRRLERARGLPPRESAAEIAAALAGYLADRLDQPPARFLGRASVDFLAARPAAAEAATRWGQLLSRCEQATFGAATEDDVAALANNARAVLLTLERMRL